TSSSSTRRCTRRRRLRGCSRSGAWRPAATSWRRGTRPLRPSPARRSSSAARARTTWPSPSVVTSVRRRSFRTSTGTSGSHSWVTEMGNGRSRLGPALAVIAVLVLTGAAVVLLMRLERAHAGERSAAEQQAAALRAAEATRNLISGLEGQTQNATTNPRLVAALDANVDQETLCYLLMTEPLCEPYRRCVDAFALYADESTALVTSRLPAAFDGRTMVRDARQGHHTSSGLLLAGGQVVAATACPVALNGRADWPVLVGIKILDVGVLSGLAERAGGAVALSDGRRALAASPAGAGGGGAQT